MAEQLGQTVLYGDIALAPDGAHVAWVQSTAATRTKKLYLCGTNEGATPVLVELTTPGDRTDADPAWSPDSKMVAVFSADLKDEQQQLWILKADGSAPTKVTELKGYAARPCWSHDGKQVAFLYVENAGGGGPLKAAAVSTGVIDTSFHNQRLALLDLGTGKLRQVSPPELNIYNFDWSPNDQGFVVTAAPGPGDNNWWIAQLYTLDLANGKATSIYQPALQLGVPRWSPDGKSIAFIEGLMSDEGFHGGDLFTVSASGGESVNRTRDRKSSVSSLFWQQPDRIVITEYVGGGSALSEISLAANSVRTMWKGDEGIHAFGNFPNFALSGDGKIAAAVRDTYTAPPEVWAGPINQWHQLTHDNASLAPTWGKAESIQWTNDKYDIQGWLIPPARVESGRKYPMVVLIHGGPSGVSVPMWPGAAGLSRASIAALSTEGYYVFLPNPRGSYGQGESFTRANVKDFGGGDLRDIMAGVDAAISKHPIDRERLGVMGWSYGGYMTMWTVTQTNRYRAAVAGAGIANWESYYGQNLIDQWMIPFFGASAYDDPAVYEKSSPIHFIKNVKTPTLVIVGERDAECPTPQSYEFWHALKALGVPTQLVIHPGEGHSYQRPENQVDRLDRTVAWFDQYLK